jgi:N-acetylmuramoyl-L-alanine amidase
MITRVVLRTAFAGTALGVAAACVSTGPTVPAAPAPTPAPPLVIEPAPLPPSNPVLPPVPHVTGPLEIKVIYPTANQTIQSKDSNFIFGSVGNGDAALIINGVSAPVWPNGAFMAWLANPPASAPQYELIAAAGPDTVRLTHPVKLLPPPPAPATGPLDTTQKTLRLPAPLYATLIGPATAPSDTDRVVTGYAPSGGIERWFLLPGTVVKVVALTADSAYAELDSTRTIAMERKDLQMLSPIPGDPAKPGPTKPDSAKPDSTKPDSTKPGSAKPDSVTPVSAVPAPTLARRASDLRVVVASEWVDFVIPVSEKPAHLIEEDSTGTSTAITLTLYATAGTARPPTAVVAPNSYVTSYTVAQSGPSLRYTFNLKGPVYGYQPLWENGSFVFRIRRPPAIDPVDPLRGLTIAVDAGHPPAGATGPTGLKEAEVTLPVAKRIQALLQARGVNVFMTRVTDSAVDLNVRPAMARRANAQALVSIHLNAVPDGVNPFRAQGTATYYYHPHSRILAEGAQRALVAELGLPDNGVHRANFALVRPTWMPAILTEGAFIIMPDQEAALRTEDYQQRYARAIVASMESYFRSLAAITR